MSKKDELFKKIKELEEHEKQRGKQFGDTDKPTKYQTGMPLGCWLWVIGLVIAAYFGLKKFF